VVSNQLCGPSCKPALSPGRSRVRRKGHETPEHFRSVPSVRHSSPGALQGPGYVETSSPHKVTTKPAAIMCRAHLSSPMRIINLNSLWDASYRSLGQLNTLGSVGRFVLFSRARFCRQGGPKEPPMSVWYCFWSRLKSCTTCEWIGRIGRPQQLRAVVNDARPLHCNCARCGDSNWAISP
jgi:hypothetical protein